EMLYWNKTEEKVSVALRKRVRSRRNLHIRTSSQMAKAQPFRLEATYAPVSERGCSRSDLNAFTSPETCV
ncbi:MAG: hypothetical protein L0I36_06845, partial [Lacticaseibacillus paracasei]|nr:hypothetical protein [Lacticaseibacillus paracasei]